MRINQNIASMNAYRNLSVTDNQMAKSLEKLSSGFRINRAADDAAGLSISEGLRSQIGGLKVAVRNAQDGVNVVQTADGALNESTAILQRMRDLAVQASNDGSQDTTAQTAANTEFQQLNSELTRISATTSFNGKNLLDGSYAGTFQVGSKNSASDQITVTLATAVDAAGLGTSAGDLTTTGGAQSAIDLVDTAIGTVNATRASLGAYQNRFEHTVNNLNVAVENLSASESQIRDTDMAQEMSNLSRSQILQQAGTSMLAQANSSQQSILKLLG
ncbi:MAG: flagellin [Pseudonocardiales bacterium]|nr:MAG: flagellin [Pseudonocardiales bacterium]